MNFLLGKTDCWFNKIFQVESGVHCSAVLIAGDFALPGTYSSLEDSCLGLIYVWRGGKYKLSVDLSEISVLLCQREAGVRSMNRLLLQY